MHGLQLHHKPDDGVCKFTGSNKKLLYDCYGQDDARGTVTFQDTRTTITINEDWAVLVTVILI